MAIKSPVRSAEGARVARSRKERPKDGAEGKGRVSVGRQIGVRIPPDLLADLQVIEAGMGLDLSSVIRMILTEHRAEYVERVRARQQTPPASP